MKNLTYTYIISLFALFTHHNIQNVVVNAAPTAAIKALYIRQQEQFTCINPGHCIGDPCEGDGDCDSVLVCSDEKKCQMWNVDDVVDDVDNENETESETETETESESSECSWPGHCLGDACSNDNDCDGEWQCSTDGVCAESEDIEDDEEDEEETESEDDEEEETETEDDEEDECSWPGHCLGDVCGNDYDCDGEWQCSTDGVCAESEEETEDDEEEEVETEEDDEEEEEIETEIDCLWPGHCLGDSCDNDNDCDQELQCSVDGVCADLSSDEENEDDDDDESDEIDEEDSEEDCGGKDLQRIIIHICRHYNHNKKNNNKKKNKW